MPTFVFYKDGKKEGDLLGANPSGLQVRRSVVQPLDLLADLSVYIVLDA